MPEEERRYISYLLRLWQVSTEGKLIWRASLENSKTGERLGFPDVADLFAFLEDETVGSPPNKADQPDGKNREKLLK